MTAKPRIPAQAVTDLVVMVTRDGELFGDEGVLRRVRDLDAEASAALREALQRWLEVWR